MGQTTCLFIVKGEFAMTETVTTYRRGRPAKGEVRPQRTKRTVGRPKAPVKAQEGAPTSFSIGRAYIDLLDSISEAEQRNKSAIIRECINRLAARFGLPSAFMDVTERDYLPVPTQSGDGDDATFTLGDSHKALLQQMGKIRHRANTGKPQEKRLNGGMTQLLRDELDRYASEKGFDPVNPPHEIVVAS